MYVIYTIYRRRLCVLILFVDLTTLWPMYTPVFIKCPDGISHLAGIANPGSKFSQEIQPGIGERLISYSFGTSF